MLTGVAIVPLFSTEQVSHLFSVNRFGRVIVRVDIKRRSVMGPLSEWRYCIGNGLENNQIRHSDKGALTLLD